MNSSDIAVKQVIALDTLSIDDINQLSKDITEELELRKFKLEKIQKLRQDLKEEKIRIREDLRKFEEQELLKLKMKLSTPIVDGDFSEDEDLDVVIPPKKRGPKAKLIKKKPNL